MDYNFRISIIVFKLMTHSAKNILYIKIISFGIFTESYSDKVGVGTEALKTTGLFVVNHGLITLSI